MGTVATAQPKGFPSPTWHLSAGACQLRAGKTSFVSSTPSETIGERTLRQHFSLALSSCCMATLPRLCGATAECEARLGRVCSAPRRARSFELGMKKPSLAISACNLHTARPAGSTRRGLSFVCAPDGAWCLSAYVTDKATTPSPLHIRVQYHPRWSRRGFSPQGRLYPTDVPTCQGFLGTSIAMAHCTDPGPRLAS